MRYGSVASKAINFIPIQVVSFSGGRTSAYLVKLMNKRRLAGENVHFTFMDTGAEHPGTYQFIRELVGRWDIPLVCLRIVVNPILGEANGYEVIPANEIGPNLQLWRDVCAKYGTPYLNGPFCTRTLKTEVFKRYCQDIFGKDNYHTWIGIRADEKKRLKAREGVSYLADISDFEKQDVLDWWKEQSFDLTIPEHLGNCVFCIKKGINKIALAARDEPELAAEFWSVINEPTVESEKTADPIAHQIIQRPFLKWAGGKFSALSELFTHIPDGLRLIEPFVGGGSVFLNSDRHSNYLLADVNSDLITMYQMLSVAPDEVIASARLMFERMNTEEDFYAIRTEFNNHCFDGIERAAAFIYLNKHCFNGLMRYNQQYQFNVGYGKYKAPYFPEAEMRKFADMSHNCVFLNAGFSRTLALAGEGDVVYCDPPYEPMPDTTGFTNYSAGGFNWDAQKKLAECCVAAHQRGARIVISNSGSPRIADLYHQHGFILHSVNGRRSISCKGDRARASDILAVLK